MKITKFAELQHVYNVINIPSLIFLEEDIWPLLDSALRACSGFKVAVVRKFDFKSISLSRLVRFGVHFGVTVPLPCFCRHCVINEAS